MARGTVRQTAQPEQLHEWEQTAQRLGEHGFAASDQLLSTDRLAALGRMVEALARHGWPPCFLLMFDSCWELLVELLCKVGQQVLGLDAELEASVFVWRVVPGPSSQQKGSTPHFGTPHRDYSHNDVYEPDGTLKTLCCWVPLQATDLGAGEGCLHFLSREHDPLYHQSQHPLHLAARSDEGLEPVPCNAGGAVLWHGNTIHQGSAPASGKPNRLSLGCAFHRKGSSGGLTLPGILQLGLAARLSLVAKSLLSYSEAKWFSLSKALLPPPFWSAISARTKRCTPQAAPSKQAGRRVKAKLETKAPSTRPESKFKILIINRTCRRDRYEWMQLGAAALQSAGYDARIVVARDRDDVVMGEGSGAGELQGTAHRAYRPNCTDAPGSAAPMLQGLQQDLARLGRNFDAQSIEQWYGNPTSAGEVALVHSNLHCLQLAVESSWEHTLVLEDDCVPSGCFQVVQGQGWQQSNAVQVGAAWVEAIEELQRAVRELRGPKWHWINLGAEKIGSNCLLNNRNELDGHLLSSLRCGLCR